MGSETRGIGLILSPFFGRISEPEIDIQILENILLFPDFSLNLGTNGEIGCNHFILTPRYVRLRLTSRKCFLMVGFVAVDAPAFVVSLLNGSCPCPAPKSFNTSGKRGIAPIKIQYLV